MSQTAERAIIRQFAAVKKADVQLQTKLGGRKGNIGINLIGAFAESDSRAFGWQLRGYAGQKSSKGANAGVFYRTIDDDTLWGANAFLDYEDGDYGGFSRFGVGGELQHSLVGFAANYYLPITDDRRVNMTVAAFSREGYDAKLRISAPNFDGLKAAMDYYNFDGKGDTKAEDGFRYGVELSPFPALHVGLFYDGGGEKFGGDIAYTHTIGEVQGRKSGGGEFAPDMFALVSREYSQRIALITMAASNSNFGGVFLADGLVTVAFLTAGAGGLTAGADYDFALMQPAMGGFSLSNNALLYQLPGQNAITAAATIAASDNNNANAPALSLFFNITAAPPIMARVDYANYAFVPGASNASAGFAVGSVAVSGGLGAYTFALMQGANAEARYELTGMSLSGRVTPGANIPATYPPMSRTILATVRVDDSSPITAPVDVPLSVFAVAPVSVSIEYIRQEFSATPPMSFFDIVRVHAFGGLLAVSRDSYLYDVQGGALDLISSSEDENTRRYALVSTPAASVYIINFSVRDDSDGGRAIPGTPDDNDPTPPIHITARITVTP